jgi:hypothetical protein
MIVTGIEEGVATKRGGQGPKDWTEIHGLYRGLTDKNLQAVRSTKFRVSPASSVEGRRIENIWFVTFGIHCWNIDYSTARRGWARETDWGFASANDECLTRQPASLAAAEDGTSIERAIE